MHSRISRHVLLRGVYLVPGGVPGPEGGVPGPEGGVPGPRGVYLVPGGCTWPGGGVDLHHPPPRGQNHRRL